MAIRLSPRLQKIADYVRPGAGVIDVGTDHAYIPIWLLQNGICEGVLASDIHEGPLRRAAADAARAGVAERLKLILCDGLALCPPDAVDTVIIAGMGGETIMGILAAAPWAEDKRLILQPQTKFYALRQFLTARGLRITDAALVYDTGRIYRVWLVEKGEGNPGGWIEQPLIDKREPLLRPYLDDMIKRLRKQIQGLERAAQGNPEALKALHAELDEYLALRKETEAWQA